MGLHDDRELNEQPATEQDALGCEASALVIGEAQALTTELGFQEAILLEAVFA